MNTGTKHTPTPYGLGVRTNFYKTDGSAHEEGVLKKHGKNRFEAISIGNDKGQICLVPLDESSHANAAFIVRACNAHDELVALIEEFRQENLVIVNITNVPIRKNSALLRLQKIDEILAKARGEA